MSETYKVSLDGDDDEQRLRDEASGRFVSLEALVGASIVSVDRDLETGVAILEVELDDEGEGLLLAARGHVTATDT